MVDELPDEINISQMWKMAALMKMCPKGIKKMVEYKEDGIGKKYIAMREKVMPWSVIKAKEGGPVPIKV